MRFIFGPYDLSLIPPGDWVTVDRFRNAWRGGDAAQNGAMVLGHSDLALAEVRLLCDAGGVIIPADAGSFGPGPTTELRIRRPDVFQDPAPYAEWMTPVMFVAADLQVLLHDSITGFVSVIFSWPVYRVGV